MRQFVRLEWPQTPVTPERLAVAADGEVRLALRHPWADGTTHVVFDPVELLGRLAVLVPRPRVIHGDGNLARGNCRRFVWLKRCRRLGWANVPVPADRRYLQNSARCS